MAQSIISSITGVFGEIFTWIASVIPDVVAIFWATEGGLTFLGVLTLVALAISIFFLLMGLIQNFLHLRG